MTPLLLVGLVVGVALGDVKVSDPNTINGDFWWMDSNSPLKAAYDYYKKCNDKGNCVTAAAPGAPAPAPFRPQDVPKLNLGNNPFLNGQVQEGDAKYNNNNEVKIDLSKNPFLSGTVTTGNGEQIQKDANGFLGVQPAQPFKPGFATSHPLDQKKPFSTIHPVDAVECSGEGFICVQKKLCHNGIVNTNGEGLFQTRSSLHYCKKDEEACCRLEGANSKKQELQLPSLNEITSGKSSVLKFTGGSGLSPGTIQVLIDDDVKPEVHSPGEGGSTSKNVRQTSQSTPDYSQDRFGDDVRFASPDFQGPAYLPPLESSPTPTRRPHQPPPTIPVFVQPQTSPRPTPTQYLPPSPSPTTYRPVSSSTTQRGYLPPSLTTPTSSNTVYDQYVPSRAPSTPRPYQPSQSTPIITPQQPYQPSSSTPRPYQPIITPQQPYQPSPSTPRPYQPIITPQQPYQPSPSTPRPYQPSITPQQPYLPPQSTPRPFQPSITPQQPYQPSPSTPRPYQPNITPQQPYQPSQSTPRPYQPNITPEQPYQPSSPRPFQPNPTTSREYLPPRSQQPSSPRPNPFIPEETPSSPYYPSPSSPQPRPTPPPYRPSEPSTPSYNYPTSPQPSTPGYSYPTPSPSTPQPGPTRPPYQPNQPSTPGYSYPTPSPSAPQSRPSLPPFLPSQPSTPGYSYPTPGPTRPSYQPSQPSSPGYNYPTPSPSAPQSRPTLPPYQPSYSTPGPTRPSYQPSEPSTPGYSYPTSSPSAPQSRPTLPPYQPSQPSTSGYSYPTSGPTRPPYQPSQPSSPGYNYPTPSPSAPQSRPTLPPYQPSYPTSGPTRPPYQPSQPSSPGYSYPTPSPSTPQPRPTIPPYKPSQPSTPDYSYPTPGPTRPPYQPNQPSTPEYNYPTPSPSSPQPRPTLPPYQPNQPSSYPTPGPTRPPYQPSTPGYNYPTSSPSAPQSRPTLPPYQPSQPSSPGYSYTTPSASQTYRTPAYRPDQPSTFRPTGYQYPKPTPSFSLPTQPPYNPSTVTNGNPSTPKPNPFLPQQTTPSPYQPAPSTNGYQSTPRPGFPNTKPPYQPTYPQQPTTSRTPGYSYPTPTPTFGYPSQPPHNPSPSNTNNIYLPPNYPETSSVFNSVTQPTSPRPRPDYTGDADSHNPSIVGSPQPPRQYPEPEQPPPAGCAAALKCVQEIYCTADGSVSPVPVVLTKEQELSRVPTTTCLDEETHVIGKCCRDLNYKDPWPSANLVNGVDDGQYKEDDGIGQYRQDLQRPVRSHSGGPRQEVSSTRNDNIEPPSCGTRNLNTNPKAPGPLDVNFAEIPWQAMILRDSNRSLLCGGAIIRLNAVLTAAHCVEGLPTSDILIKGGEWKLGIDEEPLPFQIVKVAAIIRHPQYQAGSLVNDLAVLVLEEKLRPSKNIGTICLPKPNQIPTESCIATGWGKRILQLHAKGAIMHSIGVNVMDNNQCKETLSNKFQHALSNYSPNTLCGYSKIDQCRVDYGSALACSNGNQYTLSGIYAWDTGCKHEGQIGGYVAPDVEWIEGTLSKPLKELKRLDRQYSQ